MKLLNKYTRTQVFKLSPFADNFIAQMQQSFASELNVKNKEDAALLRKFYDHQAPAFHELMVIDGHCVAAYIAANRKEYFRGLPLPAFFAALGTVKIYFIDYLDTSMKDFPFESFKKRNTLKKMLSNSLEAEAFSLAPVNVVDILELFYFSGRYERSAIMMIADGSIPVALRLCKDGNFHMNYRVEHEVEIKNAAIASGMEVGDLDLCWRYKVK